MTIKNINKNIFFPPRRAILFLSSCAWSDVGFSPLHQNTFLFTSLLSVAKGKLGSFVHVILIASRCYPPPPPRPRFYSPLALMSYRLLGSHENEHLSPDGGSCSPAAFGCIPLQAR